MLLCPLLGTGTFQCRRGRKSGVEFQNVDILHQDQPLDAEPSPPSASSKARTLHHRIIPPHLLTSVSKRLRHSFLFYFAFSPHLLTLLLSVLAKPHHKQLIAPLTLIQRLNKGPHQLSFPFERTFIWPRNRQSLNILLLHSFSPGECASRTHSPSLTLGQHKGLQPCCIAVSVLIM